MAMQKYERTSCGVAFTLSDGCCTVEFLRQDILRVCYAFRQEPEPRESYAALLVSRAQRVLADEKTVVPPCQVEISETAAQVCLEAYGMRVEVAREPFALTVFADGRRVHRDLAGRAYGRDGRGYRRHFFAQDGFTHYYGFGEKSGELDKYRRRLRMYSSDTIGYDAQRTDPLYKHIPFFLKHREEDGSWCGVFYDNPSEGAFDLGCEHSGYWEKFASFSCEAGPLDYYLLLGDTPQAVVRAYAALTGTTCMPPLKTMGYMASTMYYTEAESRADQAIASFVDEMDRQEIPCDGYHMSSGYTALEGKRCVFHWNQQRFPDPAGFCREMAERGILLSPNVKPAMLTVNPLFERFASQGAFLKRGTDQQPALERYWGGQAAFIDFTAPEGRRLWKEQLRRQLLEKGIPALWDDNNEYEISREDTLCAGDGEPYPARHMKPVFANLMARMAVEATQEHDAGQRPYVLSRAGYAGIQRYAQTWSGDNFTSWRNLRFNIPMMLGMSLSGVANQGSDVGGFMGPAPDAELFVRWVQNGIFQPRFCIHSCNTDNTVTQPWSYPEYTPVVREAIRLRYALAAYLYGLMRQASLFGDPVMRPMLYEFPEDPQCLEESFDFCYGPFLLVASVLEPGARTREVYLPKGCDWFDWYTHQRYTGGQRVTLDAPLERIPLLYREGTVLPLVEPGLRLTCECFRRMKLLIQASRAASFTLYEDDGVSNAYRSGAYLETLVEARPQQEALVISFTTTGCLEASPRAYELEVDARAICPLRVDVDGAEVPQLLNRSDYDQCERGWYFHMTNRHVMIRLPDAPWNFQVRIDYARRDLIGM